MTQLFNVFANFLILSDTLPFEYFSLWGKNYGIGFANKRIKLIQQHDFITVMSNTVALLRTVKSSWRIVHSVQTVSVANGPYSEHIRSVHLIMTSEHSVLRSVRSVRIVTVRMLRAVDGSYAPNKSSELLTVRILSTYGACIYGPYDPYES